MAGKPHSGRGLQIGAWGRGNLGAGQRQAFLVDNLRKAALEILGRRWWELKRQTFRVTLIYGPGRWLELVTTIHWFTPGLCLVAENGDIPFGDALLLEINR